MIYIKLNQKIWRPTIQLQQLVCDISYSWSAETCSENVHQIFSWCILF
jgi:hypothetical protein